MDTEACQLANDIWSICTVLPAPCKHNEYRQDPIASAINGKTSAREPA